MPAKENDTARLVSLPLPVSLYCLSFYYHMKGKTIDTLKVFQKLTSGDQNETVVWSKRGNQGNAWINGRVNLIVDIESKIIFEGSRGTGFFVSFVY